VALVVLPLVGLLQRTPWTQMRAQLLAPDVGTALRLSLECSVAAVALSVVLGVPLAWMLARVRFPGQPVVRALVTLPMVLPPVVGGVALLLAFGRRGFVGQALEHLTGVTLPFTTAGAVLAEAFVAMPFLVVAVEAGIRQVDRRYEEAAATLGAGPWTRFWRVTLPLIAPSLGAGAALCWARALGEFGATITFAGNFPGRTQTMPLAVYIALETNPDGAVALSLILLAVSLVVLVGLRHRWLGAA
jgi:molybdate transport system permease protein